MSLKADLAALFNPVLPDHFFWLTTPDGFVSTEPFVIAQTVGGRDGWYVDQSLPEFQHARVQFWVWGPRVLDVETVANLVRSTLAAGMAVVEPMGAATDDYNEALKLYGSRQDFGIWYGSP